MKTFNPISPAQAAAIITDAGIDGPTEFLANNAVAGLIKTYAQWVERLQPNGGREEVRDKRLPPELWRRIIAEGKLADVLTGTVRLAGSTDFDGGPKYTIVGIRIDDVSLLQRVAEYGNHPHPPAVVEKRQPNEIAEESQPQRPSAKKRRSPKVPDLAVLESGALLLSVAQVAVALARGRTWVYARIKDGTLVQPEGDTRVTAESVRRFVGMEG